MERARGFSLIELMVVITLLVVLLGLGVPAFEKTVRDNRLLTEFYALRATLTTARSEALSRRMPVLVCHSTDGTTCAAGTDSWSAGYLAYADADADGDPDPDEIFITRQVDGTQDMSIRFRDGGGTALANTRFSARGDSLNFSGTFTFCDDRGAGDARGLILENAGDARAATDTNDPVDSIVNDIGGANVSC